MSSKKRKLSGLGFLELQEAYKALLSLKDSSVLDEKSESQADPNEPTPEGFDEELDKTISMMASEVQRQQSLSLSGMTFENLNKLNIRFNDHLLLKLDIQERVEKIISLGKDSFWSSDNFYRHLLWLEGHLTHVPRSTNTSARAWIDAFLFRASAMLAPDRRMVVNMEGSTPTTTVSSSSLSTLPGSIDYIVVVTSHRAAAIYLTTPRLHVLETHHPCTFFIIEAKLFPLSKNVPQAVFKMYTSGKSLQTKFIRGALTNGREWIFLHLKFTDDYEGASYSYSTVIESTATAYFKGAGEILRPSPDLIAAILEDWIEASFSDIGSDNWFELSTTI